MGALHAGHLSLLRRARSECDLVVVSVFVNPTQFGPREDYGKYPRPFEADLAACRAEGADLVFNPQPTTIYPAEFRTFVEVTGLSDVLEGKFRPGHFRGVSTVVLKLLNIVSPDVTYFGQKDFQQQLIVRRMCRDLDLPCEIRVCPTVREPDGLALSSRNVFLGPEERQSALALYRALCQARGLLEQGESDLARVRGAMRDALSAVPFVAVDYATLVDPENLEEVAAVQRKLVAVVAARVGSTRLIDNLPIELPAGQAGPI